MLYRSRALLDIRDIGGKVGEGMREFIPGTTPDPAKLSNILKEVSERLELLQPLISRENENNTMRNGKELLRNIEEVIRLSESGVMGLHNHALTANELYNQYQRINRFIGNMKTLVESEREAR